MDKPTEATRAEAPPRPRRRIRRVLRVVCIPALVLLAAGVLLATMPLSWRFLDRKVSEAWLRQTGLDLAFENATYYLAQGRLETVGVTISATLPSGTTTVPLPISVWKGTDPNTANPDVTGINFVTIPGPLSPLNTIWQCAVTNTTGMSLAVIRATSPPAPSAASSGCAPKTTTGRLSHFECGWVVVDCWAVVLLTKCIAPQSAGWRRRFCT